MLISFLLVKEKFDKQEYTKTAEFVSDFDLMVWNCLCFNGEDHHISRKAEKLQYQLEQRLNLLGP